MAALHKEIYLAIRLMASGTLVLGALMIVAPFGIEHHSQELNSTDYDWFDSPADTLYLYCMIRLSKIWQMYWAGIMVVLTSLIVLVSYAGVVTQNWLPKVDRHKGVLCTIFVFLSMVSALVLITQEAHNMGIIRGYNTDKCIYKYNEKNNAMHHYSRLMTWFYILIIPSNIVVGLCVIQHIAIFVKWTLEVTSNIENSTVEHNPGREYPSPSYLTQPPPHNSTDTIGMKDVKRYHDHQQPTHQQRPSQDCDHRFSYHTPQPPHCHQYHHAEGHPHRSAASQEAASCVPTAENGQKP